MGRGELLEILEKEIAVLQGQELKEKGVGPEVPLVRVSLGALRKDHSPNLGFLC